ncbi:hypothetical protein A6M21_01580 [Desulfotomaculum copahuensis]|uniref:Uncharacterized protein n=1 Tax=Desulfotomaculum copahuensis TaxID=1838280 RepID=A0A1B7LAU9_9FIRM|nr:hypothetical protein A6M21_01580 [Desulfotomaculum copahuensis]
MSCRTIYLPEAELKAMATETAGLRLKHHWKNKLACWDLHPSRQADVVQTVYNFLDRYLTRCYPHIIFFGVVYLFIHIFFQLIRHIIP